MIRQKSAALLLLLLLGSGLLNSQSPPSDNRPSALTRRILILNETNPSARAVSLIDEAIREETVRPSKYRIEIYTEYMDALLFPEEIYQRQFRDFYVRKYRHRRPDVIITVGSSPLRYMAEDHRQDFGGIPVIFCLPNGAENDLKPDPEFSGVTMGIEAAATLDAALQMLPNTQHVLVVGGTSAFDRQQIKDVKQQLENYRSRIDITYATDLAMADLLKRLNSLPKDYIVLVASLSIDGAGKLYSSAETGPLIVSAAKVPVFSLLDLQIGYGQVGGDLVKIRSQGTVAGDMALKILGGMSPSQIPIAKGPNGFVFDWRALKRWGIREGDLPPGSIVLNRPTTAWELYRWYIIFAVSFIALEAFLISALMWQRARRRRTEQALSANEELLRQFIRYTPAAVAMFDNKMRYLQASERWLTDYHLEGQDIIGRSHYEVFPDIPDPWKEVHHRVLAGAVERCDEDPLPRADGGMEWLQWEVRPWYKPGDEIGGLIMFTQVITPRKRADVALRESEERFRSLVENATVGIYRTTPQGQILMANPTLVRMLGNESFEELAARNLEAEGFEPDYPRQVFRECMERDGEVRGLEEKWTRRDGSVIFVRESARAFRGEDGKIMYYDGIIEDITERKQAEEAMRESEGRFRTLSDHALVGINIMQDDRFIYVNPAFAEIFGYRPDELIGLSPSVVVHADDQLLSAEQRRRRLTGELPAAHFEFRGIRKDGETRHIEVFSTRTTLNNRPAIIANILDITERKHVNEALQKEKAFTEAVIDSFPDVFFVIQASGKFLHWGRNPEKVLGYTKEETMAMENAVAIVAEEDRTLAVHKIQEGFTQGTLSVELHLLHRDGRKIPYLLRATRAVIGQEIFLVGFGLDITERRRAEAKNAHLAAIVSSSNDAIFSVTRDGFIDSWNAGAERMYGHQAKDIIGKSLVVLIPEDRQGYLAPIREKLYREEGLVHYESEHLRKDGSRLQVLLTLSPIKDAMGVVTAVSVISRDMTERQQAEAKLKSSEEKFRKAFMTGADAYYISTLNDGKTIEVNDSGVKVFGYTREEMIGKSAQELGLYADAIDRQRMVAEIKAHGYVKNLELRGRKKGGQLYDALLSVNLLQGGDEPLILGVARDITEQNQREQALRESEARLKEAEYLAHLGSSTWDVDTDTTTWSDELYHIVGRDPHLPPPKHQDRMAIYTPESWERLENAVRRALTAGEPYDLELEIVRPDGTRRHVHARGLAQRGESGRIVRLHGTLQDITERFQLEQQFLQAQKMEAVGRLAGGVAHDFNNLLGIITGYTDLTLEDPSLGGRSRQRVEQVKTAAKRAVDVTRQLLAFSRKQVLQTLTLDLNAAVRDTTKMLGHLIGEDVALVTAFAPDLGSVEVDPAGIDQVLMNLAVNARDAMPEGGKLTIETANVTLDATYAARHVDVPAGSYIALEVSDTGTGMDAETCKHIFEPFFTTKEPGRGTGLGLSTVYGIVQQSGGYISVYSEPGCGTTFTIYLPRVDAAVPAVQVASVQAVARGSETVLLVEDDEGLRKLNLELLHDLGYTVLPAGNADEAIAVFATHTGPVHLLMTDIVMPGMNGQKLAEILIKRCPELRVLFVSGYTDNVVNRQISDSGAAFLQKPLARRTLAAKLREVLDAPATSRNLARRRQARKAKGKGAEHAQDRCT